VFHELAKASREDCNVDLHGRFPAWGYPAEVAGATSSASDNPGAWRCPGSLRRGEITTGGLFASAVERSGLDGRPVLITNAEMTALVGCCHLFADYVVEFAAPYARIKLGELANVGQLLSAPTFRWPDFERLVHRHDAADAVAYVLALLDRWLGIRRPPPAGARFPENPVPPRTLWFARGRGGFVVSTAAVERPEDVIVRSTLALDLVRHLGAETVGASAGDERRRWYGTPGLDAVPLRRRLVHGPPGEELAVRLSAHWSPEGLDMAFGVPGAGEPGELDLLVWFGDTIVECVAHETGELHAYDRRRERRMEPATVPFRRAPAADGAGAVHTTTIPWSMLPTRDARGPETPLMLGVRRWPPGGEWPRAGTLFPVLLGPAGG
jgi:hypothetical protein